MNDTIDPNASQVEITLDRNAYNFQTEVRVRLSETDAVGVVFFGSFATYIDVGRMDYLNQLALPQLDGPVRGLMPGAVVNTAISFGAPARYNDVLLVNVRLARLGRTSYTFHFLITPKKRPATVIARAALTLVYLDPEFRAVPLPEEFRRVVREFEGANLVDVN